MQTTQVEEINLSNDLTNQADKIIELIDIEKVFLNPIEMHPINFYEKDLRNVYFIVLTILSNTDSNINKNQKVFLQRLLNSANEYDVIEDYFEKSKNIDSEFIKKLVEFLKDTELKYNLVLDMFILLTLSDDKKDKQIQLISDISLILDLKPEKLKIISKITKSIIEQDKKMIVELIDKNENVLENFVCYIKDYYVGVLSFNKKLIYCYGESDGKIAFKTLKDLYSNSESADKFQAIQMTFEKEIALRSRNLIELESERVVLDNYFSFNDEVNIEISESNHVHIKNCDFVRSAKETLRIKNCKTLIIEDCNFASIEMQNIILENVEHAIIKNCLFKNCQSTNVIDCKHFGTLELRNNVFEKNSFKHLSEAILTIENVFDKLIISENKFIACKNMSTYGTLLLTSHVKVDKYNMVLIEKNIFEKCFGSTITKGEGIKENNFIDNVIDTKIKLV